MALRGTFVARTGPPSAPVLEVASGQVDRQLVTVLPKLGKRVHTNHAASVSADLSGP